MKIESLGLKKSTGVIESLPTEFQGWQKLHVMVTPIPLTNVGFLYQKCHAIEISGWKGTN